MQEPKRNPSQSSDRGGEGQGMKEVKNEPSKSNLSVPDDVAMRTHTYIATRYWQETTGDDEADSSRTHQPLSTSTAHYAIFNQPMRKTGIAPGVE